MDIKPDKLFASQSNAKFNLKNKDVFKHNNAVYVNKNVIYIVGDQYIHAIDEQEGKVSFYPCGLREGAEMID